MDKESKKGHPLTGVLALLYGIYLLYGLGSSTMDRYKVTRMTQHIKTVCVGRFLVDLPASMDYSLSRAFMDGFWISGQEETQQAFEARVLARQAEIEAVPNKQDQKNMEKVEIYDNNDFKGKIFIFGRDITKGKENGKPVEWINLALEGYVYSHGKSFSITTDGYNFRNTDNLRRLIDKLRLVSEKEIPTAPGFCFGPGMFIDPLPANFGEGVTLFAGFPEHLDFAVVLDTRAGLKSDGEGRLERNVRVASQRPLWLKPLFTNLRRGKRTIDGIEGDEIITRVNELNFVNTHGFDWEVDGTEHDVFVPYMHFEMSTGNPITPGARPVISFLGEEALLQLWDKMVSSIRVRPTGAVPLKQNETQPAPKLGDSASAGEICPVTGWWDCKDGGKGAAVAGGQRQFLKKGERMPQALLLQGQTLWDKLRGVQASYRLEQSTGWTLIDRRHRERLAPAVQLAAAGTANGGSAMHSNGQVGSAAKTGDFADTGSPCPAGGWWRCEDTGALDGTRCFAPGELLPPATFQVSNKVVQRRTRWQLVRQLDGHDGKVVT